MKKQEMNVGYGSLFPWPFLLIGIILLIVAVPLAFEKPFVGTILIAVSGFILTAYEGTVINKESRSYVEYKSFFFIKSGKTKSYSEVEKIFINKSKTTQRLYTAHTTHSSIFSNHEFNAFLKFDNGVKVKLKTKRNKAHLMKFLHPVSLFLSTSIEDNSSSGN
jgi:hypothetical protein